MLCCCARAGLGPVGEVEVEVGGGEGAGGEDAKQRKGLNFL